MELKKIHISDIGKVVTGKTPRTSIVENYGGDIPFLTPSDDLSYKSVPKTGKTLTEQGLNEVKNCLLPPHSVCVSCIGTDLGKVVMTSEPTITNQQFNSIIPNRRFDADFVYYLMTLVGKELNYLSKTSTAVPIINKSSFSNYEVEVPDLETQEKIASILSSLDSKIELNRRINDNLEAMAKQLYDYWFVQFDFPDENGKPYKSSGGKMVWDKRLKREIPLLWKAKIVEEVADVYNGATPSTVNELNYGGDIVWITPKDLSDQKQKFVYQGERNISQVGYDSCSTHLLPSNTILMSSRAPIGLLAIAKTELCTNQGFKSFVSKSKNIATYLYYYLQYHITQIEQLGTGTTFKEVSREDILKFPMLKPSDNVLDLWEEIVSALNDRQLEIQKENENLTKQRDELLPLLMNGQVSVNYDLADD